MILTAVVVVTGGVENEEQCEEWTDGEPRGDLHDGARTWPAEDGAGGPAWHHQCEY